MPAQPAGRWPAVLVALALASLVSLGRPPAAGGHAFLVRTDPPQGARLPDSPGEVGLEFSEAVTAPRLSVQLGPAGRARSLVVRTEAEGRVVRAELPAARPGIHLVSWGVVGSDGDETQGEFAFAIGRVTGSVPPARVADQAPDPLGVAAGWLFFAGLALAAGGLATGLAVACPAGRPPGVRAGLATALAGAWAAWAQAVTGLGPGPVAPVRQQILLAAAVALLGAALLVRSRSRRPWPVAGMLVAAAATWSARGHGAVANGLVGGAIDVVHLLAGATWAGALALLVDDLWRSRRRGDPDVLARARAYARLAAVLIVVLAAAGLGSALLLLNRPAELWSTGYGRLLLAKSSLFLAALGLALAGRRRGLRPGGLGLLRRATPAEAGLLGVILVLSAVLVSTAPPAPAVAAATLLGPPPMAGPVARDAGMAGILTVAVTAGEGQVQVEVIPPGRQAAGARARIEARLAGRRVRLAPRPCGEGCFAQHLALPPGTTRFEVAASAPGWRGGTYTARLGWPPLPEDPALLSGLVAVMRAVPVVEVSESVSSGPEARLPPGPYPLLTGEAFIATEPYAAGVAEDIRPLAPDRRAFGLYLPGERIWITLWLGPDGRLARERIVNVGHVIERTFRYPPG